MSDKMKFDPSTGEISNSSNRVIVGCGGCFGWSSDEIELRDGGYLGNGECSKCGGDGYLGDVTCNRCNGTGICPGCKGAGVIIK